jgi:hypothetical protein
VPGTTSDHPHDDVARQAGPTTEPVPERIRVTSIYATPWHLTSTPANTDLPGYLRLWRFEEYYRLSADQLPGVLNRETLDHTTLKFRRWTRADRLTGARIWLFALPSGQIAAALSLDAHVELIEAIDLLEDCYFADVSAGETTVEEQASTLAVQLGADTDAGREFLPERHQIVLDASPAPDGDGGEDLVQRLIYRADLPYRKEYSAIRYPAELNRRPGWLAAVGPYVSVICGHPDFLQNAIFISAVQAVAAAAQLRAIRQAAYADVRQFRSLQAADGSTANRRRTLERIADQLGDLELELSYSVEATADLGLLIPSLRASSFHNALYESMSLADKAITAGNMLERLSAAISAELTAIESAERRTDDNRRIRYAVAVGFVSVVAIPASLILAYLGINASQVNPDLSMFSDRYLSMYLAVTGVILLAAILFAGLYLQQRRNSRHQRAATQRSRWTLAPEGAADLMNHFTSSASHSNVNRDTPGNWTDHP